jgi:hypothetical protein
MSPSGRVLDMQGVDAMLQTMASKIDIPNPQIREVMQAQMKAQFGADNIKRMTESSGAVYPDKPAAVGETWVRARHLST